MTLVRYEHDGAVATITMDDGKANALSPTMLAELNDALDHADTDGATVVLTGRAGILSAGFDLTVLRDGGDAAIGMVRGGFELAERLLSFPHPVVIACSGHAIAMGAFLLLSGDYRIGAAGPFRYTANEVVIGITMPYSAIEITRQRLAPAHVDRALLLAEVYGPDETGIAAGWVDRVVDLAEVVSAAQELAARYGGLDMAAHGASKLRVRGPALAALRAAMAADDASSPLALSD